MNHLKRLGLTFALMSVLAVTTFAGITETPPCVPGETLAPPCVSQSVSDDSTDPGQTNSPPASDTVDLMGIVEAALWALSLF
jgi:hypothetical protein